MAKRRRPSSRHVSRKPVRSARARVIRPGTVPTPDRRGGALQLERSDAHNEAVRAYERGVGALQRRDYGRAAQLLEAVIDRYPDEKELHERVRLYLNVCRRQAAPPDRTPRTLEERVYAATLAINAGAYENGLTQLRLALEADPSNDHVHYMLAVVQALRRDFASSLAHLQRAVELNPDNRFLALQDADLAGLREANHGFRTIIDGAFGARRERRDGHRPRASR
jgi:tetratricopeptide (TPR) repeat protein